MQKHLCIHGHFYQSARNIRFDPSHDRAGFCEPAEEPYIISVPQKSSMFNCYAWTGFDFGPASLSWLEQHVPPVYHQILEGDRLSLKRLGHGNALAQAYHHIIMPLSTEYDRECEIAWSVADFQARFHRQPEGMWLPETAVDTPTLESLAAGGLKFVILEAHQAAAVADKGKENWQEVEAQCLDTTCAYEACLPSGRKIAIFFSDNAFPRVPAFEHQPMNGENCWQRLFSGYTHGLRHLAGELYGPFLQFDEKTLAYVLEQGINGRDGAVFTNYAAWLSSHPPARQVRIHENSSWSCVHGIARWDTNCGCRAGEHPEWQQFWRKPLRRALNYMRYFVSEHYARAGREVLRDPHLALPAYGEVLSGAQTKQKFAATYFQTGLRAEKTRLAWQLLAMQRWSLASFFSSAWAVDDIGRAEPLNALGCALCSLDLMRLTGGPDCESGFLEILDEAWSNDPQKGTGRDLWYQEVLPRRLIGASLFT